MIEPSSHGQSCLYHVDLPTNKDWTVTDVAAFNPGCKSVRFVPTSTVTIYVSSFGKTVAHGHHDEEMKHEEYIEKEKHEEYDTGNETKKLEFVIKPRPIGNSMCGF